MSVARHHEAVSTARYAMIAARSSLQLSGCEDADDAIGYLSGWLDAHPTPPRPVAPADGYRFEELQGFAGFGVIAPDGRIVASLLTRTNAAALAEELNTLRSTAQEAARG